MVGPAAEKMWREGASAWPRIELARNTFLAFVSDLAGRSKGGQAPGDQGPDSATGDATLDGAEVFLICACLRQLPGAYKAFQSRYVAPTRPATHRMGLSAAMVADIEQLACQKLFVATPETGPKILDYVGQGNLAALVRVIVVRTAVSQLRKQKRELLCEEEELVSVPDELNDPALNLIRSDFKKEFGPAFAASLAALSERDRNLLRLRFVDGLPLDHISRLYQVHRVTASRNLSRIRRALRDETRARLRKTLQLSPDTLDSFMKLVDSRLDMSIDWELESLAE